MPISRPFTPPAPSSISLPLNNVTTPSGRATPPDQDMMMDTVQPSPRPSLASSLAEFALPHSAPPSPSTTLMAIDEPYPSYMMMNASPITYPLLRKLRRPSLLGIGIPKPPWDMGAPISSNSRMNSPLVTSFTSPFAFECPPNAGSARNGLATGSSSGSGTGSGASSRQPISEDDFSPGLMYESTADPSPPQTQATEVDEPPANDDDDAPATAPSTPLRPPIEINYSKSSLQSRASAPNLGAGISGCAGAPTSALQPPAVLGRPAIPRLLTIMKESDTQESEVKSEASFQRLVASHAELPIRRGNPRTPRSRSGTVSGHGTAGGPGHGGYGGLRKVLYYPTDKGRFPEEAFDDDDFLGDDLSGSSDDGAGDGDDEAGLSSAGAGGMSVGGGDSGTMMSLPDDSAASFMSTGGSLSRSTSNSMLDSPAGMDLDLANGGWGVGSPPVNSMVGLGAGTSTSTTTTPIQWRHTPPPTITHSRGAKRKFTEDRYEPYANSAKRRAVSPAVSFSNGSAYMGMGMGGTSSPIPIAIPRSPMTMGRSFPLSATSSPILRPVVRLSGGRSGGEAMGMSWSAGNLSTNGSGSGTGSAKGEEREVQGAGDGVGSLTL